MNANNLTTIGIGTFGFIIFLMFRRWLWLVVLPPAIAIVFYVALNTIYGPGR